MKTVTSTRTGKIIVELKKNAHFSSNSLIYIVRITETIT